MPRTFVLRYRMAGAATDSELRFGSLPIRMGRNALNDCSIPVGSVSDFHARIEELEGRLCIRDLNSTNGVYFRNQQRIAPEIPVDLAPQQFEFWLGPFVQVRIEVTDSAALQPQGRARGMSLSVLGNQRMLSAELPQDGFSSTPQLSAPPLAASPRTDLPPPHRGSQGPAMAAGRAQGPGYAPALQAPGAGGLPSLPPGMGGFGPPRGAGAPGTLPPLPAGGYAQFPSPGAPSNLPPLPAGGFGYPPTGGQGMDPGALPPPGGPTPGGKLPSLPGLGGVGPTAPMAAYGAGPQVNKQTSDFAMSREVMAFVGLKELAGSLVPGIPFDTTGDIARLITKLNDAIEVFCRCYIPLRDGYTQFVSSMDLQRARQQRTLNRSRSFLRVEMAQDPGTLAGALLDFHDPAFDAAQAVEGVFADLMLHQLGLLEGVMRGVRALLDEISPEAIEKAVEESGGGGFGGKAKALWQMYRERYEEFAEEKEAFSRIFGPEFTQAYREYQRRRGGGQGNR